MLASWLNHPDVDLNGTEDNNRSGFYWACALGDTPNVLRFLAHQPLRRGLRGAVDYFWTRAHFFDVQDRSWPARLGFMLDHLARKALGWVILLITAAAYPTTHYRAPAGHRTGPLWNAWTEAWTEGFQAWLTSAHLDVNQPDRHWQTPFHATCQYGHTEVVKALLADPRTHVNPSDHFNDTPFYSACSRGHAGVVKILLADPRTNIHHPNGSGETPLYVACMKGRVGVVKAINAAVARRNLGLEDAYTWKQQQLAEHLLLSAAGGNLEAVKTLVKALKPVPNMPL